MATQTTALRDAAMAQGAVSLALFGAGWQGQFTTSTEREKSRDALWDTITFGEGVCLAPCGHRENGGVGSNTLEVGRRAFVGAMPMLLVLGAFDESTSRRVTGAYVWAAGDPLACFVPQCGIVLRWDTSKPLTHSFARLSASLSRPFLQHNLGAPTPFRLPVRTQWPRGEPCTPWHALTSAPLVFFCHFSEHRISPTATFAVSSL